MILVKTDAGQQTLRDRSVRLTPRQRSAFILCDGKRSVDDVLDELDALSLPTGAKLAYDMGKNPVLLFENEWSANYFGETNKNTPLSALPVQMARE